MFIVCPICKSRLILSECTRKTNYTHDYYRCKCKSYNSCGNWIYLHDGSEYLVRSGGKRWGYLGRNEPTKYFNDKEMKIKETFIFR